MDANQNYRCDASEASTIARNGAFTITSTSLSIYDFPILAVLDTGVAQASALSSVNPVSAGSQTVLAAPNRRMKSDNVINGITTLISGAMDNGLTLTQAVSQVETEIKRANIAFSGSLLNNLNANELSVLEANVVKLSQAAGDKNRSSVLASAGLSLADYKALTEANASAEDLTKAVTELSKAKFTLQPLNDTGLTKFFSDASNTENQTENPSDYPGQDAMYGLDVTDKQANTDNGFKFKKLDAQGNELADDATEWSCVSDERTGLIWEVKSNDTSSIQHLDRLFALEIKDRISSYEGDVLTATCQTAGDGICTTQQYADELNKQQICGLSNWRLPAGNEIFGIIDFGETSQLQNKAPNEPGEVIAGLNTKYFPNQTIGSDDDAPYVKQGIVWSDNFYANGYGTEQEGVVYFNSVQLVSPTHTTTYTGKLRKLSWNAGRISQLEIYTGSFSDNSSESYVFPTRLVAHKEKK
ncbi:lipoprotein, putative [Vibrio nigripulchritudo ATCC 27043]|nr:lipoprotein, putative [Vibrio nigripulchritudo ATCC 27043]